MAIAFIGGQRLLAVWVVRPRLLGVSGVSQVTVIGGERKQYQVLVAPARLVDHDLTLAQVKRAVSKADVNASGGFLERPNEEYLIRARGRIYSIEDLENAVVTVRDGAPILVKNIASALAAPTLKRGDGSFNMQPAVIATIQKQPNANTLEVTTRIEESLADLKSSLPPGASLKESNRAGNLIEVALREVPEVVSTTRRTGRAELDEHAAGVNTSEPEVVTKENGRPHAEVMEDVRQKLSVIPGVAFEVGQPISHRIDHLLSGARAQIAIKLFGPDLATLRTKAREIRDAMANVPGIVDLLVEPQVGAPQAQINLKRQAAAAVGLSAGDLAAAVDTAFNGEVVSQALEEQRAYDVLVRLDNTARESVETITRTLIDTPTGAKVPIGQVADVRVDQGPNTINRENAQRRIIIQANIADRDLGSVINNARSAISRKVALPQGYFIRYGGQFEAQEKASRQITLLSIVAIAGIFLLLYIALRSTRAALLVMANLPLALIGGVAMVFLSGGALSVASLIGFITLFGIAARNGIMLITHYRHLMEEEGVSFRDAIAQGSMERLSPILMTALVTSVGLIPLALGTGEPGREIQQPMAVVILGGIFTSTFLNMIVIPALYLKFGKAESLIRKEDYPHEPELVTQAD